MTSIFIVLGDKLNKSGAQQHMFEQRWWAEDMTHVIFGKTYRYVLSLVLVSCLNESSLLVDGFKKSSG